MERTNTEAEALPLAVLLRHTGQPTKYRILEALNTGRATPTELSERLGLDRSNVTSQLADLRKLGFVDFQRRGRNHVYTVKDPLPSIRHELLIDLIDLDQTDPNEKPFSESNNSDEDVLSKIQSVKSERMKKKLELWANYLSHPGLTSSGNRPKQLKTKIKQLTRRIHDLKLSQ